MPAQKDFRERNSHCQLSVRSADKSWRVIAALVMLANKGITEQVEDQQWRAERSSAVWGTSFPHQPPAPAQQAGWGAQAGELRLLLPSLCPTIGSSGAGCQPCSPHGQLTWAQVLLHHLSSTEGTQVSLHFEAVTVSVLSCVWNRMEEEQRKKAFPKQPHIWGGLLLNSAFGLTNVWHCKGGMKLSSPHSEDFWRNSRTLFFFQ